MDSQIRTRVEDMVSFLGEHYGTLALGAVFGKVFGIVVGVFVGLLLLSAVNTAIAAMIGMFYLLAKDGEMPRVFGRLNPHGVPWLPLGLAVALPVLVVTFTPNLEALADLYAIGVVGAISVNLGACSLNKKLHMQWWERLLMFLTFLVLLAVELTIAKTKGNALFFALCVLGIGLSLRGYSQKRAGLRTLTVTEEFAAAISPEAISAFSSTINPANTIMVAARGLNPVLRFALEEARLRKASLYVLYVKEVAVNLPGPVESIERPRWQDDEDASKIMCAMLGLGKENDVPVVPIYALSDTPAGTILDLSATMGVDILMLGTSHRRTLVSLLKGNIVTEVAKSLPENIQLLIYG
jgi:nucleotide-binding universal stress UspA family protein